MDGSTYTHLAKDAHKAIWWVCVVIGAVLGVLALDVVAVILLVLWLVGLI
jgi:hypothetical protein